MKIQGYRKAITKASALGRASNGQRIVISGGYQISDDVDGYTAIEFTTPESKSVLRELQEVFINAGMKARIKVLSMDKSTETFTYYLQVKP